MQLPVYVICLLFHSNSCSKQEPMLQVLYYLHLPCHHSFDCFVFHVFVLLCCGIYLLVFPLIVYVSCFHCLRDLCFDVLLLSALFCPYCRDTIDFLCNEHARSLRSQGQRIPAACKLHNPPCLMQVCREILGKFR